MPFVAFQSTYWFISVHCINFIPTIHFIYPYFLLSISLFTSLFPLIQESSFSNRKLLEQLTEEQQEKERLLRELDEAKKVLFAGRAQWVRVIVDLD